MWMTQFVMEVKRRLRDEFGLVPDRVVENDEPCFETVPDGIYPMQIEDKDEPVVVVIANRFYFLEVKKPVRKMEDG